MIRLALMSNQVQLLYTKLHRPVIPAGGRWVARPRLIERLQAGLPHKLTLISAPAGFGKTTLLTEWIHSRGEVILPLLVAWLSLDENDNEPLRFWSYLLAALQTADGGLAKSAQAALQSPAALTLLEELVLTPLLNEIAVRPEPIMLVLDDYHLINTQAIHDGLTFLLDHQPPQFHLVIATRADPPLPVFRWRARGQLTELRAKDLRFTAGEATAFLNRVMGLDLSSKQVEALETRTEGWIAGLQLAALSLQDRPDPEAFVAAFSGSHHYVLEYLAEEVLRRQPETVRSFLLQTSILERLCGPLCDVIAERDDGAATLDTLYRANLFLIPLDDERRWYRYHHLFADLLRNRLRQELPAEQVQELHRRASEWYWQEGWLEAAVHHALAAEDYLRAADLIEREVIGTMLHGQLSTLQGWLDTLPAELLQARPRLQIYGAWVHFLGGRADLAERQLLQVREKLQERPASAEINALRGELAGMLLTMASMGEDTGRTKREAQEALRYLPPDDLNSRARALRALGVAHGLEGDTRQLIEICTEAGDLALTGGNIFLAADIMATIASTQVHEGRLSEAAENYQRVVDLAQRSPAGPQPFAAMGLAGLAEVHLEWDDLAAAERYMAQAKTLTERGGIGYTQINMWCTEARLQQALGRANQALSLLRQAERICQRLSSPSMGVHLASYQVRLRLLQDDVSGALRWLEWPALEPALLPAVVQEVHQVSRSRVCLAQGRPAEVLAIYEALTPPAKASGRMARVIELGVLRALALQMMGESSAALQALGEVLAQAELAGYVRSFLELGRPMADLLKGAAGPGARSNYLKRLLQAFGDSPETSAQADSGLIDPLTEREQEVLELIAQGYSNREIANTLTVTLHTIKKHNSNIYAKLGVRSRTQAIGRARNLGLIT